MPSLSLRYSKKTSYFTAQLGTNIHAPSAITSKRTLSAEIGEVRTSLHPLYEYWANREHSLRPFHRPALRRRNCRYRLEMHSMNWLNVAAFNSVDIDFDVGRKFL